MVLSGKPHKPPGSVAPWKLPGGQAALRAQRARGASDAIVVGVGGPNVPNAIRSDELAEVRRILRARAKLADREERKAPAAGEDVEGVKKARARFEEKVRERC